MELDDGSKYIVCKHMILDRGFCKKIGHEILNGYASMKHCKDCKFFEDMKDRGGAKPYRKLKDFEPNPLIKDGKTIKQDIKKYEKL